MKKTFLSFLSLAILATVLMVSCKKTDQQSGRTTTDAAESSFTFKPVKGDNAISTDLNLSQFRKISGAKKPVKKIVVTNASSITVSGLKNNISLTDAVLQLKSNPSIKRTLGTINKDQVFKSPQDIEFLQKVADDMLAKKTTKVDLVLKSSDALNSDVKVTMKVNVNYL